MQIIKWTIVCFMLTIFFSEECQASFIQPKEPGTTYCTLQSQDLPIEQLMDTLLAMFFSTPGDLLESDCHNTYDKKNFHRLFLYSAYSHIHSAVTFQNISVLQKTVSVFSDPVVYYIYRLQKIVI